MKWPRGKYNGMLITGLQVTFKVDLMWFEWRPRFFWNFGEPFILWLWFQVTFKVVYTAPPPADQELFVG